MTPIPTAFKMTLLLGALLTLTGCQSSSSGKSSGSDSSEAVSSAARGNAKLPVISSFNSTPSIIVKGGQVVLNFVVKDAQKLILNPGGIDVSGKTSYSVSPLVTTDYSLQAINSIGQISASARVEVSVNPVPKIVSFSASANILTAGQSTTLNFSALNASSLAINPGNIVVTGQTSKVVTPTATTTYTITAVNGTESANAAVTVTVNAAQQAASLAPYINVAKIPAGSAGSSKFQVYPVNPEYLNPDLNNPSSPKYNPSLFSNWNAMLSDIGAFRTACGYSHMGFDDPIVFPGQPGKSHLHTFFGNTLVDAYSTQTSIATTGNSTCRGGIANRSSYWVPTMIDTLDGTPIKPSSDAGIYYKTGYNIPNSAINKFPQGLRMIAGNSKATSEATAEGIRYKCLHGPDDANYGYIPSIPKCKVGEELIMEVFFPQCWDGKNLDSPDHKSHMAYPSGGKCPSTHPIGVPEITFNIPYLVGPNDDLSRWRLSSDNYDKSLPGGFSGHGDWFYGWDPAVADAFTENCDRASKNCHSHLLGDGRYIE